MLQTVAIRGYRALRLLADCGRGEVISSLAREGGLQSVLWAGPEQLGDARRTGKAQGTPARIARIRLRQQRRARTLMPLGRNAYQAVAPYSCI